MNSLLIGGTTLKTINYGKFNFPFYHYLRIGADSCDEYYSLADKETEMRVLIACRFYFVSLYNENEKM